MTCNSELACTEFKFPFSMTQSELSIAKNLKLRTELKEKIPDLTEDTYVKENIAILHIYTKKNFLEKTNI